MCEEKNNDAVFQHVIFVEATKRKKANIGQLHLQLFFIGSACDVTLQMVEKRSSHLINFNHIIMNFYTTHENISL